MFHKILEIDPKNDSAQKGLRSAQKKYEARIAYLRGLEKPALKSALGFMKKREWVEAVDQLSSVLKRQPDHPEALQLSKEVRQKVAKQHAKAKNRSSEWFYTKGVLAYIDGDWFQAANAWEQVYSFNPNQISLVAKIDKARNRLDEQQREERLGLYQSVAWDSLQKGRYDEAVEAWKDLLKLDPKNYQAQEGIKQAETAAADESRRRRLEAARDISAKAMDAYLEHNDKESVRLWEKVLSLDPENAMAKDYLERISMRSRSRGSSYDDISRLPAEPISSASGYQKALAFLQEQNYVEAIEYLERHVNKYPEDNKAQGTLEEARQQQKNVADKAYQAGLVAYSQGEPNEAVRLWQEALKCDPDYQKARQALIKALAEQQKP
jgi:tetratricopeptide (TPR) repeat protein